MKTIFRKISAAALFTFIFCAVAAQASMPGHNPESPATLYGNEIYFDVYRKGEKVGYHRVTFEQTDAGLFVDATFMLRIEVLLFTAYRYHYQSRSEWRDGWLRNLQARVDDDGKLFQLDAARVGNFVRVSHGDAQYRVSAPILPTDHWNSAVLSETRVLNTLTGLINDVRIKKLDRTMVETENGPVSATHYAYTGDLTTEVWYDDAGRWVKLRFQGKDGSTIDYQCRRCQGGGTKMLNQ